MGRAWIVALLAALPLAACDSIASFNPFDNTERYKTDNTPIVPAERLYNEGLSRLKENDYSGAVKRFENVDRQHPMTDWARRAILMQAFANYEGGQYEEAVSAAKRYMTLHGNTPDAAYAQYLLAMSYYNQVPDIGRDQERSALAAQALADLVQRYPTSEYVTDARYKLSVVRDQLAGKEMTVGRFYLEKRQYTAAINRFRDVVAKYQTTRHVEEALMRLTEAYMALGIAQEAQTAAAVLGHNFPDSPWYKDAFKLLQSGGLEPRENQQSWISRAFRGFTRTVVGLN
ncbi:outer membrane protein assembly factor BamD [Terrirubrum flagellatum]|uniref:outer membrane protein assembly factor BamD n=1 Tax=Terrirubrum flagellatum TaxID=2895980 RepID=UPI003CC83014